MAIIDVNQRDKISIPHEEDQWMELKPLTGAELQKAEDVGIQRAIEKVANLDLKLLQSLVQPNPEADTTPNYDEETLIDLAVTSWSYDHECTTENKGLLDPFTRKWLGELITERNTHSPLAS